VWNYKNLRVLSPARIVVSGIVLPPILLMGPARNARRCVVKNEKLKATYVGYVRKLVRGRGVVEQRLTLMVFAQATIVADVFTGMIGGSYFTQ
jgi:hypothetical protein